ncbi:hypothetical protein LOTGIDRAFT_115636 [Lottia gigantea]|uniref:PDZ domain-containing protein n=1 Tax=Lottia gigantea TaxID=225164 RepID=V3ZYA1_LOTGI|nr:hypothetical protein LOTGIDRAFT_115636 [Lottia gigantea]ESO96508.1 hypothetical protein LOTGIDRAFT_115636 [Lottia gigantea]
MDLTGYIILIAETAEKLQDLILFISGSPADRVDLSVGDEIVEVNGMLVEKCSHSEVIAQIHKVSS